MISNTVVGGDKYPFFLEAGSWFTISGSCEVQIDNSGRQTRKKINATEQQIGPFVKDAQILIEAIDVTTVLIYPAEAW